MKGASIMPYMCPVCGYPDLSEDPRPATGGGSYEICPSCGFQFGVSDDDRGFTYAEWRATWVAKGMPWNEIDIAPPEAWDPERQLLRVKGA